MLRPTRPVSLALTLLAWLVVLAGCAGWLVAAGAPAGQVLAYLAAWLVGSTLPGVLIWRALAGHTSTVRELGFGSALGIVLQLAAWAVGTAVHHPLLMWLLPAGTVAAFASVPGLRWHWRPRRQGPAATPLRWHLSMAVVIVLAVSRFEMSSGLSRALPPNPSVVVRDTWYNSAIAYEVSRTLRPRDPFAVAQPLRYHWFADASVSATAELSRVPIATAMVALWVVPMLVVLALAMAAVAEHVMAGTVARTVVANGNERGSSALSGVRRWWVGPLAGFSLLVAPAVWQLSRPWIPRLGDGVAASSPSGILALVLILALVGPVFDLLRGEGRRGTWVVLALLLCCSAGTKPSILPVVAFGAVAVVVADLVRHRRLNRPMAAVALASVALVGLAAPVLIGSTGGSRPQLLALIASDPSYYRLVPAPLVPASGGWLLPALAQRVPGAIPIVAMLVVAWVLSEAPRLLSLVGAVARPLRADPAPRWAFALLAGGYGAMWVLAHPGFSQHYFWTDTLALATALTVANAARVLPPSARLRALALPLTVAVVPALLAAWATTRMAPVRLSGPVASVVAGRLLPYGLVLVVLALTLLAVRAVNARRQRHGRPALPLLAAVTAYALAVGVPVTYQQATHAPLRVQPTARVQRSYSYVSPEQGRAATWLGQHSATTAVVATNISCWPLGRSRPGCTVNAMWISGISGRRMLLGDWTYSSANMVRYGGVLPLNRTPAPYPRLEQLSLAAAKAPTPAVLGALRDLGVQWLLLDDRATPVSPTLRTLASRRYASAHIGIYRLRTTYR